MGNEYRLSGSSKKMRKALGQPISAACRTCWTFNAGAVEGAIGIALAPVAASAASAAEESRTAIGLLIEALHEWISLMERVWPCRAELQLNVRREKTPRS